MQNKLPKQPRKACHIRIPAFLPVPLRSRRDGWTPFRQAAFLVALARTRSVSAAADEVGLSRVSAYHLRNRPGADSFAAVWDMVLNGQSATERKFTPGERYRAAIEGQIMAHVWRGRCTAISRKYDAAALRGLLLRMGSTARNRSIRSCKSPRFGT